MCELEGDMMQKAVTAGDAMENIQRGIDAFFAPHLARAGTLAAKIHRAALDCAEVDDNPEFTAGEIAAARHPLDLWLVVGKDAHDTDTLPTQSKAVDQCELNNETYPMLGPWRVVHVREVMP